MALSLLGKFPKIFKINILSQCSLTRIVPRVYARTFSFQPKSAQFLNPRSSTITCKRLFFKFFRKPSPEKLRVEDGIPEYYKLIYRNTMQRYILSAQIFSFASAAFVLVLAIAYSNGEYSLNSQKWRRDDQPQPFENEGLIYVGVFIFLCVILQVMVSKMPIRIYNHPEKEKYLFVFYGNLPLTKKRLACKVKEVIKLEETGLLPWKDSRYEIVNKQRIIMLENFFRRPADLNIMLGYQKPPENYD